MNRLTLLAGTLLLGINTAFGWGQKGHDVVAEIATRHLTETTRYALDSILGGRSIVYYSNWLDNASHTPKYNYSLTWHYKNVDADLTYDTAPQHSKGDVVTALRRATGILLDPKESAAEHELAVKMIIHLVGDMHQPMHLGHQSNSGGNKWKVNFFDSDTQLHSVWDSRLTEAGHKWSYTEWADQLDILSADKATEIMRGNFDDWARESWNIATDVYRATPQGTKISYDYIAEWTPMVETQLLKGGLRLSDILNSVFDPTYIPVSSNFQTIIEIVK